jgi:hypothetical protein
MKNNKKPDYPRNLLTIVIGYDYEYPITSKTIERFENFLNSFLSYEVPEVDKEIILLQYKEGLPATKICKQLDISANTVNRHTCRIISVLRTLKNLNQFLNFEEDYKIYIERIQSLITQLNNPQITVNQNDLMTDDVRDDKDDKIENMKLSKRAYNALKRARINTVSEIVDLLNTIDNETKKNCIYNTINIGQKVYNNILEALDLYYMSNDFFKTKYKLEK